MNDPLRRASFFEAWLDDLKDDVKTYGARRLVPWSMILCLFVGGCSTLLVKENEFWNKPELATLFFTAMVTINGLLLALSWGSFAKIYEIASRPEIAQYLRKHNLLSQYTFMVDYIHYSQVVALSFSGMCLILGVVQELPLWIGNVVSLIILKKVSFACAIGSTIYALKYALGAVRMMQDLVWYGAHLSADTTEPALRVHDGGRG